jgi:hypothetical protein
MIEDYVMHTNHKTYLGTMKEPVEVKTVGQHPRVRGWMDKVHFQPNVVMVLIVNVGQRKPITWGTIKQDLAEEYVKCKLTDLSRVCNDNDRKINARKCEKLDYDTRNHFKRNDILAKVCDGHVISFFKVRDVTRCRIKATKIGKRSLSNGIVVPVEVEEYGKVITLSSSIKGITHEGIPVIKYEHH